MAELRHAVIATVGLFVLFIAAGASTYGSGVFQLPVLGVLLAVSVAVAGADAIIRRMRGIVIGSSDPVKNPLLMSTNMANLHADPSKNPFVATGRKVILTVGIATIAVSALIAAMRILALMA